MSQGIRQCIRVRAHTLADVGLTYDHGLYFDLPPRTRLVPLSRLRATKPPEGQPQSVAKARALMAAAAAGQVGRRSPLLVRRRADGDFDILDGNATYGAAREAGWPDLPVVERRAGQP
jgi:hypothetical protein